MFEFLAAGSDSSNYVRSFYLSPVHPRRFGPEDQPESGRVERKVHHVVRPERLCGGM